MGFYSPSRSCQDAKRHGVEVRPADVLASGVDCSLERGPWRKAGAAPGLGLIKGLKADSANKLVEARKEMIFQPLKTSPGAPGWTARPERIGGRRCPGRAFPGHRGRASGRRSPVDDPTRLELPRLPDAAPRFAFPPRARTSSPTTSTLGLTLRRHPLALLRERLKRQRIRSAEDLSQSRNGSWIKVAGIVTCRQRPATASGVIFVTLEDETGT
jgi:error-prone DNA polymerase